MKKASKIFFLVGGILSFIVAILFLTLGILFFTFSSDTFKDILLEGLRNGTIQTTLSGSEEEIVIAIQIIFRTLGVTFLVLTALPIVNAIFAFIARKRENKALYILNIVFGFMSDVIVNAIGGIFGLISLKKPQNTISESTSTETTNDFEF